MPGRNYADEYRQLKRKTKMPNKRGRPPIDKKERLYAVFVRVHYFPFLKLQRMKKERSAYLRSVIEDATKNLPDVVE